MIDPKGFEGLGGCPECGRDHGPGVEHGVAEIALPSILGEAYERAGEAGRKATIQIVNMFMEMAACVPDAVEGMVQVHAIAAVVEQIVGAMTKAQIDHAVAAEHKKDEAGT